MRTTSKGVAALAIAASASALVVPPAHAAAVPALTPTTWTHNIAGNAKWGGKENAIWPIIYAIASFRGAPQSIGIQEACLGQAQALHKWLRAKKNRNYKMAFRKQNVCKNGQPYGIAVYALGNDRQYSGTFKSQRADDGEKRGYICLRTRRYLACTAHMSYKGKDNGRVQREQFQEMLTTAGKLKTATGLPVYWGGDFYMTPAGINKHIGNWVFRLHREGDMCHDGRHRMTVRNLSGTRKVDYVVKTAPARCAQDAIVHLDPAQSDHALVGGFL